jgi:hypothetical protein
MAQVKMATGKCLNLCPLTLAPNEDMLMESFHPAI